MWRLIITAVTRSGNIKRIFLDTPLVNGWQSISLDHPAMHNEITLLELHIKLVNKDPWLISIHVHDNKFKLDTVSYNTYILDPVTSSHKAHMEPYAADGQHLYINMDDLTFILHDSVSNEAFRFRFI